MLGARAGEDVDAAALGLKGLVVDFLDLAAGDVGFAVADTQHLGDAGPRHGVVAGDHGHPDAALVAFLYGGYGLIARRIDNTDEAEEHEFLGEALGVKSGFVDPGVL